MRTKTKTDRQVLEDALALIEGDDGWIQGTYCRDADGVEVRPVTGSPGEWVRVRTEHVGGGGYVVHTEAAATPCRFCLGGALRAAAGYWNGAQPYMALDQVERLEWLLLRLANSVAAPAWPSLQAYNDDAYTTKADAVLLLKRAAAHLDAHDDREP
ncbi:hypothetical protein [Mycobacterium sp. IS-3022]|uniref:DUF6197 family protein n=1 Tax=Mycobacterium sp. IS-3022 TaxID=1772277 RepID=UPI0007416929|nr:hypothetical protein [Mycobacterium sp. IS-3022]KUI06059.1 hypothetical protein AU188_03025 [Mycobacterium sp. IS-3022]